MATREHILNEALVFYAPKQVALPRLLNPTTIRGRFCQNVMGSCDALGWRRMRGRRWRLDRIACVALRTRETQSSKPPWLDQ